MQTQVHPRYKKRVPCEFAVGDSHQHHGMVLNISEGGLFVSSRATPQPGSFVKLDLDPGPGASAIPVRARVVWRRKVHRSATTEKGDPGIGLVIEESNEEFDRFVSTLARGASGRLARAGADAPSPSRAASSSAASHSYSVRLALPGTPRTRIVRLDARDVTQARELALRGCKGDWEILDISSG